jgi:hypothetical protein
MATAAQLRFARDKKAEDDIVSRQADRTQQNLQKKNRRMGLGRIAGTLLGAALTGGSSLAVQAAAAGLGSLAGQKLAQGSTRKLDPLEEGKFNRDITRDLQDEYDEGLSDLDRAAVQRAGSDAFSIFAVGGLKNVPGMEKLATAGEKFAAGGAEGGLRDVARGGISKASRLAGEVTGRADEFLQTVPDRISRLTQGGQEGGVRDLIRRGFNNNPLTQAIENTGANITNKGTYSADAVVNADATGSASNMTQIDGSALNTIGPMVSGDALGKPIEGAMNVIRDISPDATLPSFAGYSGTANQNQLLAQALGLNPNQSLVDQLRSRDYATDMASRADLFQSVMNPSEFIGPRAPSPQSIAGNYLGLPITNYRQGAR